MPKPAFKPEPKPAPKPGSFEARIVQATLAMHAALMKDAPDTKHNVGHTLAQALIWDTIQSMAKKNSDALWKSLEVDGHIPASETLAPGDHAPLDTPHFVVTAKATLPVKRFSPDQLAQDLYKSKYKVPLPIAKQMIDEAKKSTKSTVIWNINERSV